jgi:gamma-glutamyltranspeptidase/glutathione hydrolase
MFATVAAGMDLLKRGDLDSAEGAVQWAHSMASAWSFRLGTPGGNDFLDTTAAQWIRKALAFEDRVSVDESVGHTCHLNACDNSGTLVSATLTHGALWFGGRWAIPNSGVIMNAGMPVLTAAPPIENGTRLYAVTNMAPTIVRLCDGSAVAIGCPGARRIPTIIGLVLARHMSGDLPLQDAISAGRFHSETQSKATVETERTPPFVLEAFRSAFASVESENDDLYYGPLTAIRREPDGQLIFGLDDRSYKGFSQTVLC